MAAAILLTMAVYAGYRRFKPNAPKHHDAFITFALITCSSFLMMSGFKFFIFISMFLRALIVYGIYRLIMRLKEGTRMRAAISVFVVLLILLPVDIAFTYYKMTTSQQCCPPAYSAPPFGSYVGSRPFSPEHAFFKLPQPGWQEPRCRKCPDEESLSILKAVADEGDAESQFYLAGLYSRGSVVPEDKVEAAKWYRRAADQGHVRAQVILGQIYRDGIGVRQDYAEAARWYRKVAETRYQRPSRFELAKIYAEGGKGVDQNYEESYFWASLAAARAGDKKYIEMREAAARHLTAEEINSVRKRVQEWTKNYDEVD